MQDNESLQPVHTVYESFIKDVPFNEIEHVPDQFLPCQITVQDDCLCISYQYFTLHYEKLLKRLRKSKQEDLQKDNWIAQVLLVMNGEINNAWNHKKRLIGKNCLNIDRQLKFNAAVCYKNKKSSSYYDYRIQLYEEMLKENRSKQELLDIYWSESKLISKVLARFFRNYYCWMYRNRLFKLFYQTIGEELIKLEIQLLHKFIQTNPNDYSAYSRLIPLIKKSPQSYLDESKWIGQLEDFCVLAYQKKESYHHIYTYKAFLDTLPREIN